MSKFKVISRDATSVRYEGAPQYSGTYLGVDYIEFKNISSPNVIDWQIGDYVDYFRTGVRYKLYTLPMPKKVARVGSYGGAIEYSNVQFFAPTKDLEIAPFRDLVLNENGIHFSTRQDVSTYEDVRGVARRIQACLDDLFPNKWRIEVYETDDEELNNQLAEVKEFGVSQSTCLDALSQIYDTWKGVGWIHYTDKENNQEVIIIGRANVRDVDNTTDLFTYGIGNGLTSIRKNSTNEGEFATRLYVYGSERNLQPRHYNQFDIVNKESVDIRNLMIPISEWGLTDGIPDAKKAYIQADDTIIEKYGLIPKTLYFDGSEGFEIYPSIQGLTMSQVRQAMIELGQENEYLPENKDTRIDTINTTFAEGDGSAEDFNANPNIIIHLNSVGFNIAEQGKKTSEGVAKISIKSGLCAGRELIVRRLVECEQGKDGVSRMSYEVERAWDESTTMGYPNSLYPLNEGDEFVLLDIPMPDYYITINEKKLLEQGKKMLADYTRVSAFYEPEVNAIRMKEVGGVITPGMYMKVKDEDIIETEDHIDYVLIDSLSIDEITEIPTYKITLREEKRAARTYSALEDMIEDAKEDANKAIKRERQYTDRRWKSAQETLTLLSKAFDNFSHGINPVNVKTMAMLVGDESLQYKFTASRSSLTDVPCPLSWNPETKQMIGVPASLIHMTLDVDSVAPIDSRKAEDYHSWNIISWWDKDTYESPFIEDAEKSYYIYVVASKNSADAWYHMSESDIPMYSEDYYYFLVGILNSEYDSSRDFVTLYGFTEVLPGQITTDVIRSSDGQTYFDLVNGVIAGDIRFKSTEGGVKSVDEQFSLVDKNVQNLQDQIDGEVENHFYEGTPTTSNYPAVEWTSDIQKINHIGDTYTDIEEFVDSQTTPNAGKSWRWCRCDDMTGITDYVEATDKDGVTYKLHWHPIADTDAVKALLRVYELERKVDDAEYLKETFKKGSTEVAGGVVMSQMVAVRDDEDSPIEAFLNGSDFAEDTENGKLILAAGISESGSKLENRAKEALTRIYENGTIETKRANIEGTIVAKSGKIGDFNITSGIEAEYDTFDETGYGEQGEVSVRPQSVKLYHYSKDYYAPEFKGQCDMYPAIGGGVAGSYAFGSIIRSEILDNTNDDSNYPTECVGIIVSAKGAKGLTSNGLYGGNFAIQAENGMFAGLRPRTLRNPRTSGYTDRYTLSKLDHTIVIEDGTNATFNLYLPTTPEIGQHYEILKIAASRTINVQTTDGKKIYRIGNASAQTSQGLAVGWGGKAELTWDGVQWIMHIVASL